MRKKIWKIFAMIFMVALVFTGCATVSDVYDKNGNLIYFEQLVSFGGQVAKIGDYLYYANGYTDASVDGFSYEDAKQTGYLSRINLSKRFEFDEEVNEQDKANTSPLNIEKVNDRFVGYQNQNMFALGSYLYFSSTNTHKSNSLENDYSQISLFRISFNGDNLQEIYTTRYDEKSSIEVVKGSDGNYHYVICAQNGEEKYELSSIKIGEKIGERVVLAKNIESYAIADDSSIQKDIVYIYTNDDEEKKIERVDFASGKKTECMYPTNYTVSLLDRCGDIVFYTVDKPNADVEVYYKDVSNFDNNFDGSNRFYSADSISNVTKSEDGYIFTSSNGALMFKTLNGNVKTLIKNDITFDVLFEDSGWIYYSTTSEISRVSIFDGSVTNVVSMADIVSGQCGYSDGYIYFFAKIQTTETEDEESSETTTDENYYLYKATVDGTMNYQLLGKTK